MPHFQLEDREVAEVRGMVGGEGVAADVGPPGMGCLLAPACGLAQGAPAVHPAARDIVLQGIDVSAAQRHHAPAARFGRGGAHHHALVLPVDVAFGINPSTG